MLLLIIIALSSCTLFAESQIQNKRNQQAALNQGQIYFADNRPGYNGNGKPNEKTAVEVQKSVEPQNVDIQDSYMQAVAQNQNNNGVRLGGDNVSGGRPQLNLNLQPPAYDTNNPNYYSAYHEKNGDVTRLEEQGDQQVLPVLPHNENFDISNISLAVSNFGINLLKTINKQSGNLVLSPFSIAELLALLQQGALGATQQQITDALRMAPLTSVDAFKNINERMQQRTSSHNILRIANNLFVADAFELSPAFKRVAVQLFGSEVTPTRFSQPQDTVQKINRWVSQATNNKIPELLSPDSISENTQLMMVNAVYFKGLWAVRFKPESTLPREFHVNGVSKKVVPFMRLRKIFRAGTDPSNNAQVILLPFENEQYSLMVVLPSTVSSLDALISQLTDAQLSSYLSLSPKEVDLEIPKFTVKADTDLNPVFRKLGITDVFGSQANLSGIGTYRSYSPQLSSAVHSALLSIDEDGGSAAAATSFAVVALSYDNPSLLFHVNRPFLAVLWDNQSKIPLFMARVQDPTSL